MELENLKTKQQNLENDLDSKYEDIKNIQKVQFEKEDQTSRELTQLNNTLNQKNFHINMLEIKLKNYEKKFENFESRLEKINMDQKPYERLKSFSSFHEPKNKSRKNYLLITKNI